MRLEREGIGDRQHRHGEDREPEHRRPRRFGLADLAQQDRHDRHEKRGEQPHHRPERRNMCAPRLRNDQHADESRDHRAPAMPAGRLLEQQRAQDRREDRHGELESHCLGQRQQQHRAEGEDHAGQSHGRARDVCAEAPRPDRSQARARCHPGGHQRHCPELAMEHRLDQPGAAHLGQLDQRRHRSEAGDCEEPQQDALQYLIALHLSAFAAGARGRQPSMAGGEQLRIDLFEPRRRERRDRFERGQPRVARSRRPRFRR